MEFGTAWCYMSLNPPFSFEHLCNLAPFQSECTTWGAGTILPLKTPNVLFSENSLFLSEAALGCCSRFLEPNRTSQSSWERQVPPGSSRFTPGMRTRAVLFFAGLLPHLHGKTIGTPFSTHPRPPNSDLTTSKRDGFLSVVFWYSFSGSGILFSNSFLFSESHSVWQIVVGQFWIRGREETVAPDEIPNKN